MKKIETKSKLVGNCKKDATKFIRILEKADGGCSYCVSELLELFVKEFPEHKELAKKRLQEHKKRIREIK